MTDIVRVNGKTFVVGIVTDSAVGALEDVLRTDDITEAGNRFRDLCSFSVKGTRVRFIDFAFSGGGIKDFEVM